VVKSTVKSGLQKAKDSLQELSKKNKSIKKYLDVLEEKGKMGLAKKIAKKGGIAVAVGATGLGTDLMVHKLQGKKGMTKKEAKSLIKKSAVDVVNSTLSGEKPDIFKTLRDNQADVLVEKPTVKTPTTAQMHLASAIQEIEKNKEFFYKLGRDRRMVASDQFGSGKKRRKKRNKKRKKKKKQKII